MPVLFTKNFSDNYKFRFKSLLPVSPFLPFYNRLLLFPFLPFLPLCKKKCPDSPAKAANCISETSSGKVLL